MKFLWGYCCLFICLAFSLFAQPTIVDHSCTNIYQIPVSAIESAKQQLHIGYGFTSHGSQITSGMTCLVEFMNTKDYPYNLFAWNSSGTNNALFLYPGDGYGYGDLDHDAGYYPDWVNETREFLGEPNELGRGGNNPEFNVIMWAWCGQLSWYSHDDVFNYYLDEMNQLESDYHGITFVYMTGHSDGSGLEGQLHQNNQAIRNYCISNDKVLFDFYDIECYDPDGNYFGDRYVDDACNYDGGNWATEWQNSHQQGVDWFNCDAAHTQPLNGNLKAYAIWWLWARLAGWAGPVTDSTAPSVPQNLQAVLTGEMQVDLSWDASIDDESGVSRYRIYRNDLSLTTTTRTSFSDMDCIPGEIYRYQVSAINGASLESEKSSAIEITMPSDNQPPTIPAGLSATPVSSSEISLSWNSANDNSRVSGYRIFRDHTEIATTSSTSFLDSHLAPSTDYIYQVSAFDAVGNESDLSAAITARTLDPSQEKITVTLENQDQIIDSFIFANNPGANYGEEPYVDTIDRFLIQFDLDDVIGKQILSAKLYLYVWNQTNYQDNQFLTLYCLTRSWDENSVTWNNATDNENWQTPGGDFENLPIAQVQHQAGEANWDHTFYPPADITSIVQQWADGQRSNYGLVVLNESQTTIGFKASEYDDGNRPYLEIMYTDKAPTAVLSTTIDSPQLITNYPNPFNASTTIQLNIKRRENVEIKIYDVQGREIETLISGVLQPGLFEVSFQAENLASGVYFYSILIGHQQHFGKMLLVR